MTERSACSDQRHHDHTKCSAKGVGATQSLSELDFDRGIWSAAMHNDIERMKMLASTGHLDDRDSCGYTALHYAARSGHLEACNWLLERGIEVDAVTNGGVTALHRAAMMGHADILQRLVKFKADVGRRDNDGRTALHRAAEGGHLKCCQLLVELQPNLRHTRDTRNQRPIDLVRKEHSKIDEFIQCLS